MSARVMVNLCYIPVKMNTGFHQEHIFGAAPNRHAISFDSSAMATTSERFLMGNPFGINGTAGGVMFSGNSGMVSSNSGISQVGSSGGSVLLDYVPGLKHDAGLAVEWSVEEQYKLEEGLVKYGDEPSIMRYIKIAATLRDKTVRDVALRCRWLARKRRKHEDLNLAKKMKDKKDKMVELSPKSSISSASPMNASAFSHVVNNQSQTNGAPSEALRSSIRHLLEQNNQVLARISTNMSELKLQDNIDLFCHMRNNLTAILNNMRYMPGPQVPVSINEELANSILPGSSQTMMLGSPIGIHMKQEPGGF